MLYRCAGKAIELEIHRGIRCVALRICDGFHTRRIQMRHELERKSIMSDFRPGNALPSKPARRNTMLAVAGTITFVVLLFAVAAVADDENNGAAWLREFIGHQVGGIDKLKVPTTDAEIPLPRQPDGTVSPRYQTTEAKRYLGKLLFHDPVRSARVDINTGQPKDLPAGTDFGGTFNATDPFIQQLFPKSSSASISEIESTANAQRMDTSCGSCHIGEADSKAGQRLNFASGGEGRGYTDEHGNFIARRRPQSFLTKLRNEPIFTGDVMVDALPTLTDIWSNNGTKMVTTPAYYYHLSNPNDPAQTLVATGRLDQLDSVGRQAMSLVGFAFNNRLLFGGIAGEPQSTPGSLNPLNDPAGENMTLLLLDAHRMLNSQSAELRKIPAFVKLFRDAFPQEAAADSGDLKTLISDDTEFRAQATFLRTVVTRNTPFDRFLAGDNHALTPRQLRGAKLFFTPAAGGAGGAGCFTCHSGPMLNKQSNDPDVAGIGQLVEDNFVNVGIGDHPVQALNALARGHLDLNKLGNEGFPYHSEDSGRQETTHNTDHAFKFRVLTLRQLKDARTFFHNGSLTSVRNVVEYFNAGVPQDPTAGAAPTLSKRFTKPRGPGYPTGLGLTEQQVDDLADFVENGLYDPAFAHYDPSSSTDSFQPNERDLTYSKYHPELVALGAKDGFMLSGLAIDNNDPLSRRDEGLEFLDVTSQLRVERIRSNTDGARQTDTYRITNASSSVVDTHLLILVRKLPDRVSLENAREISSSGDPYMRVFLQNGVLEPGQSIVQTLAFRRPRGEGSAPVNYTLDFLSGQGHP
jgi:Di-haem cytochrome c peroxidase